MRFTHPKLVGLLLSLTTLTAQASLTASTAGGESVVYDNVTNSTWTGDANLLGTLESTLGYNNVVNAIIAASPVIIDQPPSYDYYGIPDSGVSYTISASDFSSSSLGQTTWWGAKAFTSYLNSISYAGSNQWTLPTATVGYFPSFGLPQTGTQLGELLYNELCRFLLSPVPDTNLFTNEQFGWYWFGEEYAPGINEAWSFVSPFGVQDIHSKELQLYAWAVSPGNVAAVPVPLAAWLFGTGLVGLLGLMRRDNIG